MTETNETVDMNAAPTEEISESTEEVVSADATEPTELSSVEDIPEPSAKEDEGDTLRAEIERLRAYIKKNDADRKKGIGELEEFGRLYPDTELKDIPDAVWEKVDSGLPLSAAFAVYERERSLLESLAKEVNQRNSALSAGNAGASPKSDYFSPDEVRVMSHKEVRENYANIRRSMDYWRKASK